MPEFRIALAAVCLLSVQTVLRQFDDFSTARAVEVELVSSDALELAGGKMVVVSHAGSPKPAIDLLVHFHGAAPVVRKQFADARIDAVLCIVNFHGLSSAYATPLQSADLFQDLRHYGDAPSQSSQGSRDGRSATRRPDRPTFVSSCSWLIAWRPSLCIPVARPRL